MKAHALFLNNSFRFARALLFLLAAISLAWAGLDAGAVTYTQIHAFAGAPTDGQAPLFGSSFSASGSTLFAMTETGGAHTNGNIFSINTDGTGLKMLHSFDGYTVVNTKGSQNDGALPFGTPLLIGDTLYGTTEWGGSNGVGVVFSINTNGTGFQVLHHFGAGSDGYGPYGSLIASGSTLFGMTSAGGAGLSEGIIFSINTDGTGYQDLLNFDVTTNAGSSPHGALVLSGSVLYGMSQGAIFSLNTDGTGLQVLHTFNGTTNDGALPYGSLIMSGPTLYGMTSQGGAYGYGCAFSLNGTNFRLIHSFSTSEGWQPYGDLTVLGPTLYGMTHVGGAGGAGLGCIFQMGLDGGDYQIIHTFGVSTTTGFSPYASLLALNSKLYGMTSAGGSLKDAGSIFEVTPDLPTGSLTVTVWPPTAASAGGEWQVDGGAFHKGGTTATGISIGSHTVSFKAISGWTTATNQTVTISANANAAITGTYVDVTRPTVTITSPTNGMVVTTPNYTITGTSHDNSAVFAVFYSFNGGAWQYILTSNKWSANLSLVPGTNVFETFSADYYDNKSPTNTVKFFYLVKAPLSVTLSGGKGSTSIANGTLLDLGKSYSITAAAAPGCDFINWGGNTNITNATFQFMMEPGLAYTANFQDVQIPTLSITSPTNGMTVTTAAFTMKGTAHDNVGVASVSYWLNGTGPLAASTSNNWASWNAVLALTPGTNHVTAYSTDAASNNSVNHNVTFFYLLKAPLTVTEIGGKGTTSIANGTQLALGESYSIAATAAPGFRFVGWLGGADSTNATIRFTMVSNLTLNAVYEDIAPPTVSITAPTAGQHLTNANLLVMGKASDNLAVESVSYQLNGGGWTAAHTVNNWTNWMAPVVLSPGTNNIQAIATDTSSNVSSTASVNFTYTPPPDWAPNSLSGLRTKVSSVTNGVFSVVFGGSTFSLNSTNANPLTSVGDYSYNKLATNVAELTMAFTLPPVAGIPTNTIGLIFDALNSGTYSNLDTGDSGTFSLSAASSLALGSLAGLTFNGTNNLEADGATITVGTTTFSQKDSGGHVYSGNYTYQKYSPAGGMWTLTYTSPANKAGETTYVQLTFLTTGSGDYFLTSFDDLGNFKNSTEGTFTVSP